jgi:hypothetical protein
MSRDLRHTTNEETEDHVRMVTERYCTSICITCTGRAALTEKAYLFDVPRHHTFIGMECETQNEFPVHIISTLQSKNRFGSEKPYLFNGVLFIVTYSLIRCY